MNLKLRRANDTKANTEKWANAKEAKVKTPSIDEEEHKEKKVDDSVKPETIATASAQFGYNELFHAAAEEASKEDDKTFE